MLFDTWHPKFGEVVLPDAGLAQVVSGFDFTEGPIWHPVDHSVIFSDILGNSIYRWSESDGLTTLRRNSYMANGNAYDHEGRVVTCEHATSRLSCSDFRYPDSYRVLVSHYEDKQLNSPNDVVVKRDGRIYFTDPPSGRSAGFGVPRDPELPFSGVYCLRPDSGELTLLASDFVFPNGLCFSPDETLLYVNDTRRQHIRVFDMAIDGTLANGRVFAELQGSEPGVADGMKVDVQGNVFSCGPGGIHVLTPAGRALGRIRLPEFTTNFVFGDDDLQTLYITASTSVYKLRLNTQGHQTYDG